MKGFSMLKVLALCLATVTAAAALEATPAAAQDRPLDAPRAAGVIGERYDGYVVLRDKNAPAGIHELVEQTNAQRHKLYEERAKATDAPVEEVGKVYAEQIMEQAPENTWFQGPDGTWKQKQ
ncbi:MAG: DUF1318 domain-containing protein [Alphaproteobacteria bacterium]|nr:DUF1318 domain-containing protein [Alphaproteobacteria bacterium]